MHQLFWDATHIDAGTSEAPLGADWRGLYEVGEADFASVLRSLLSCGQSSRATTYNEKLISSPLWFFLDLHQENITTHRLTILKC